jgi:hypothetical protein
MLLKKTATLSCLTVVAVLGGCASETTEPIGSEEGAIEVTSAAVQSLSVTTDIAMRFAGVAVDPPVRPDDPAAVDPMEPQGLDGMAGSALEPGCTSVHWNLLDPLRLTVEYQDCELPSGEVLDGTASIYLSYEGSTSSVGLELEELRYGATTVDGLLVVSVDGEALHLSTDVRVDDGEGSTRIVLRDARIAATATTVQVDGEGSFTMNGDSFSLTATALLWDGASCYPSSGTLTIAATGQPTVDATFGHDAAGPFATVSVAGLPPFEYRLTCP